MGFRRGWIPANRWWNVPCGPSWNGYLPAIFRRIFQILEKLIWWWRCFVCLQSPTVRRCGISIGIFFYYLNFYSLMNELNANARSMHKIAHVMSSKNNIQASCRLLNGLSMIIKHLSTNAWLLHIIQKNAACHLYLFLSGWKKKKYKNCSGPISARFVGGLGDISPLFTPKFSSTPPQF